MQSCLCAITALLLGCGARGLHIAEDPSSMTLEDRITKAAWMGIFTAQAKILQAHDMKLVANATVPTPLLKGLENMKLLAHNALKGKVTLEYASGVCKAAFLSQQGAVESHSSFDAWWTHIAHDGLNMSTDAYAKELRSLLNYEITKDQKSGHLADFDPESAFSDEEVQGVVKLADTNADGLMSKGELQLFAHGMKSVGCHGLVAPEGGLLPTRACAPPEGTSQSTVEATGPEVALEVLRGETEHVDAEWVSLANWLKL